MKVNIEQLSTDAGRRLEDACIADGLARHAPEAVRPATTAWGPTEAGGLLADQWRSAWETYEADLYALRDRLSGKASQLAQTAADFAGAEIAVSVAIASVDETEAPVSTTDDYVALPGGDGFNPDYRNSETAAGIPAQLSPEPAEIQPGSADLEAFTADHLPLLDEAELLLTRQYGEALGFRPPTKYLGDLNETDAATVVSHIELTTTVISILESIYNGLSAHSVSLPDHWESDAASAYLDVTADTRQQLSNLERALTSSHDKGMTAANLLDDMLLRAVQSATTPRTDGQSHIQRIRQAVERIQDLEADQRSHVARSGWETIDPGADQDLLDIAYRGLWQRIRGLSHSWSQCVDGVRDEAEAIGIDNAFPRVAAPPGDVPTRTGSGSSESDTRRQILDTVSDTEEGEALQ